MPPSTTTTNSSSSSALLSDPILAPFLSSNFSASTYINSSLPPLLPPPTLSSAKSSKPGAETLSALSSKATTLLSTLDLHTQRLIAHLQTLTDEILRVGPRLGYEVDLLRGDVIGLGETLEVTLVSDIARFSSLNTSGEGTEIEDNGGEPRPQDKPEVLDKLEMLATVRSRLEEVIRIFGEAMDWGLPTETPEEPPPAPANPYAASMSTPALPTAPPLSNNGKLVRGQNPTDEILYLLASNDIAGARKRVDELKHLATVFHGTIEGPARSAVVEALDARIQEEEAKEKNKRKVSEDAAGGKGDGEKGDNGKEKADDAAGAGAGSWGTGREGYYGLINQLSRMRGIS
ncbi:hypothetical protein RUND412_004665 [Rhizina undulata]